MLETRRGSYLVISIAMIAANLTTSADGTLCDAALAVGAWRAAGIGSALFAVTFIFSLYFVLEATGLRHLWPNFRREAERERGLISATAVL